MIAARALNYNLKDSGLTNNGQRKLDFEADDEQFTCIQQQVTQATEGKQPSYVYEILSVEGNQKREWIGTIDLSKKNPTVEFTDQVKSPVAIDTLKKLVADYKPAQQTEHEHAGSAR
jgi:hypothetical protein